MEIDKLKYVVGSTEKDTPAVIRFFGPVNHSTTERFNDEFLWLQNVVQPSRITVLINSEGGSVIYGMSTFSIIQSCPIEVDCIIEGIAASMGSIIWAAGTNLYMHDYSLVMIHNPFSQSGDSESEDVQNMLKAFRGQLETIYHKRFGIAKSKVRQIMNGEGEADGTYLSAKEAVEHGILPESNILKTSKQVCEKVHNQIEGITNVAAMRDVMVSVINEVDETKLLQRIDAIHNQNDENHKQTMNENKFSVDVIATLGFQPEASAASVTARITELLASERNLASVQAALDKLQIQYTGKETEAQNLSAKLSETEASLKKYQAAEQAAIQAEIVAVVDNAISAGKIDATAKDQWVTMAQSDLKLVKSTLETIPAREKITEEIATDPANVDAMQETLKTAEAKMAEQVETVVGKVMLKTF